MLEVFFGCVDELGQVQQQIESADHYLAATWTGLAHTAYENTSRNQLEALHGMIESFEGAAQLLDEQHGYRVTHVVTAGAPVARLGPFPDGSHVLSLEQRGDVVPLLDGDESRLLVSAQDSGIDWQQVA